MPAALDLPSWRLPRRLRPLLLERGSLTDRLAERCPGGEIYVQVLHEGWSLASHDECRRLGLPGRRVWIREVLLQCGEQNWVHARSLVPPESFHALKRALCGLGSQPLGRLLFTWQGQRCGRILLCRDAQGHFGRISRFTIRGRSIWVGERFLGNLCTNAKIPDRRMDAPTRDGPGH
ncbi:MAG: chorismate--pyruvate lyase family protein [Halothiobacillaceae bacterium]